MMSLSLVSDRPLRPYEEHLLRMMNRLDEDEREVDGLAVVVLYKDGTSGVSYSHMDTADMIRARGELGLEIIDNYIFANLDRFVAAAEGIEDENEGEENT